ncbi:MAG TPA: TonB-dependent receptor [Vicinamibacterales bacterium]|nr:TonB-dependent receptor [Vicinamibacterales bacterium]
MTKRVGVLALLMMWLAAGAAAQDTTGSIEGTVTDHTSAVVAGAKAVATNLATGFTREALAGPDGFFRLTYLPVGEYVLTVTAPGFATTVQEPVRVAVSEIARVEVRLELASVTDNVTETGGVQLVDTATNTLGRVITGRELVDLPLNGRNFTQLGLLQTGVAPLTAGVTTAGGTMRRGHAYAVNGLRPEQNAYLVDGALNQNRLDSGFALQLPVDAIAEFRILTQSAPPEYGGTAGATTSVVTRSGSNLLHGSLYEFLRNDVFDARNFFSEEVEPLDQHQFGLTLGGPIRRDRVFFFGYYEGFRNRQGVTTTATVPTPQEREGDFSGMPGPLLNLAAGGVPFPGNRLPPQAINPVGRAVVNLYPLGNVSPSIYRETVVGRNVSDQFGGRVDFNVSSNDQIFLRYSYANGYNINPVSVRGTDVPGYPTRDDLETQSAVLSNTHIFTSTLTNSARLSVLRHDFFFDQRLNQRLPSSLGFGFEPANGPGRGTPFFNISGYTPIGGAITGPRNSEQLTFQVQDSLTWAVGSHLVKTGVEYSHTSLDFFQAIAPNAFFVFASTFPTNHAIANLLLGAPVVFYQGLGDFNRGLRVWNLGLFAQDEWRITRRLTFNYGLRYERINPFTEVQDRLNGFIPGVQSVVRPDAPRGLVFPGDPGIGKGIAHGFNAYMPRVGFAWDPTGSGRWSVRTSYGIYFDPFQNGAGAASQIAVSALPWTQFNQLSGAGLNFQNPYANRGLPRPETFVRPSTVFALDHTAKPPYSQTWNLSIQRSLFERYLVEIRYVGAKGTHLPRNIEANPAVFGPGATPQNADRRRIHANCPPPPDMSPCDFSTVAMTSNILNSSYHGGQASISRRYESGLGFNVSYWFSKSLDYLSAMNLSGASAKPLAGENDLAQNPFDLDAERGPSLFDARHRFVASFSWEPNLPQATPSVLRAIAGGWQINAIAVYNSGTPFTVSDSANVAMQANSPPISGFAASRPDLVGDPNSGPRTVDEWISRSAFRRLNIRTEAGKFGNAGRNIARGPSYTNVDMSLVRNFALTQAVDLQFRAEAFNVFNHPNFGIPVADLNSANFGRILTAGPPRLLQFGLKVIF